MARKGTTRPRGYAPWSHEAGGRYDRILGAAREVFEEYADVRPLTVRQVYYRLVARPNPVIGKTQQDYWAVAQTLVDARRGQLIPFEWLRDDTNLSLEPEESFADAGHFIRTYTPNPDYFYKRLLDTQPYYMEVVCEAAGMAGQLATVAHEYGIRVTGSGGFDSVTAKKSLADRLIEEYDGRDGGCILFHLGDLDVSGGHIRNALLEDLEGFEAELEFVHVAVLPEHIAEYDLPTSPDKPNQVQCEALEPRLLQRLLREAIDEHWDKTAQAETERWIEEQRGIIREYVTRLPAP
jgi:hypothetical protein